MADQSRWKCLMLGQNESPAAWIASRPELKAELLAGMSPEEALALEYDWEFWARRNQIAPEGDWTYWLLLAGRGFGKTRCGAQWVIRKAYENPRTHGALIAPTASDTRKVMLSAGLETHAEASGILAVSPPWFRPRYEPSLSRLTWPNGTIASLYTAEEPKRLRGPQHHWGWVDELAAWQADHESWDQFLFGLRLGENPQACITTTPLPIKILRDLLKDAGTVVTRGSTYDNRGNLSPKFYKTIVSKYEGTRLGRQELLAEILDDVPGALWTRARLDENRRPDHPDLYRVVVGVDPAGSHKPNSDETGIVVVGAGIDDHGYTLADRSCRLSPEGWAKRVVDAFWEFQADRVVAEANFGGEMVEAVIHAVDSRVPVVLVRASRGKQQRAEPVATMDEQGRDHHVGSFPELEDQMCNFAPGKYEGSPDRMDAKVWAYSYLFFGEPEPHTVVYEDRVQISPY